MGRIHVLPTQIANMIAAGEVIERPASVIKELVENAVDAQAKRIDIWVTGAGRKMMRVRDDGIGMDVEDAHLAFVRHATSKILYEQDLFRIRSLGFRGEALPSIAAVSKVTLETSTGVGVGTLLIYENNECIHESAAPLHKGTTITVEQLFYNTPARLKHLKSDYAEVAAIQEVVIKLAFAHPTIRFQLTLDDRVSFQTTGRNDLLEIIADAYGIESSKQMLKVSGENSDFRIEGYISNPTLTKANRYQMITLLNGRAVRMLIAQNAMLEAFHTYIPDGRYPLVVLHIETDPVLTDINVHPSKHEVRLSKEDSLVKLILEAFKQTLQTTRYPEMKVEQKVIEPLSIQTTFSFNEYHNPTVPLTSFERPPTTPYKIEEPKEIQYETPQPKPIINQLTPLAQIHGTYIIASTEGGFYLIDQHAAAERINYEKFLHYFQTKQLQTTALLIPLLIELNPQEAPIIFERFHELEAFGLRAESFGPNALRIIEVPEWMQSVDLHIYTEAMLNQLVHESKIDPLKLRDYAVATLACKASLKANHALSILEMEVLLQRLLACANPFTCPHGRPTMIFYSTYELEKAFKRVGV